MYNRLKTTGNSAIIAVNVTMGTRRVHEVAAKFRLRTLVCGPDCTLCSAQHLEQFVTKSHEDLNSKSLEWTEMKILGSLLTRLQPDAFITSSYHFPGL